MARKRLIDNILLFFATCGFIGYLPFAPGTWASLLAMVLIFIFPGVLGSIVFAALFALFAVICVNLLRYGEKDPSYIVIDEFAGMFVAIAGHQVTITNVIIGFVLFRVFDILKPYPIRRVERLKKGYGVVADDVLAGIFANAILLLWWSFT